MNDNVATEKIARLVLALTDPERLRLMGAVLEEPHTLGEIATVASLDVASTLRHLKALERAELVEATAEPEPRYRATLENPKQVAIGLAQRSRVAKMPSEADVDFARWKVLSAFFDGPRLRALPLRNHRKKKIVLEELLRRLPWQSEYHETELDDFIKPIFDDYCSVRRAWIDFMYMQRDHGIYSWTPHGLDALNAEVG
jgi:DNA-binding transcriptional ArsR family regulator